MDTTGLRLLGEGPGYWDHLKDILGAGKTMGSIVHDAHVIAICRERGVREVWTADRDYSRYKGIRTRNPLVNMD